MYPDSQFARPVSSFRKPAPITDVDPDDNPDLTVCFRKEWLPYIIGSLRQLLLQSTWDTTDPDALNRAQGQAQLLISMFMQGCDSPDDLIIPFGGLDEDIELTSLCENIRFQDGKLQALCCGAWVDISGQPVQGWAPAGTGGGTTPPVAGACATYKAVIQGNGYWYAPFTVNTGDTIAIANAKGATYDPAGGVWFCPDGSLFFAGACLASTRIAGGNPMPAVLTGKLIAKIGATFYDVQGGTFTVPAGVSAQPVQFQFNYASISGSSGEVNFDVTLCNNASATFSHLFNLKTTTGGFTIGNQGTPNTNGVWVASSGYRSALPDSANNAVQLYRLFSSRYITSIDVHMNRPAAGAGGNAVDALYPHKAGAYGVPLTSPSTSSGADYVFSKPVNDTWDGVGFSLNEGTQRTLFDVFSIVINGLGTDPF